jgi:hypothetical protein
MIFKRGTRVPYADDKREESGLVNEGRRAGVAQVLPGCGV